MATIPRQSDASARNTASLEAGVLLVILVMGFAVYLSALGGPMFRLDDGYIVLNNAQALFAPDRNFPDAPALYGSTSLLHTIAAALTGALVGPELGLMVLAWIAIGLFGLAILELARDAGLVRFEGRRVERQGHQRAGDPLLVDHVTGRHPAGGEPVLRQCQNRHQAANN